MKLKSKKEKKQKIKKEREKHGKLIWEAWCWLIGFLGGRGTTEENEGKEVSNEKKKLSNAEVQKLFKL